MSRDECITAISHLLAGLAVPVSMEMPLGKAGPAWVELHTHLVGFGWSSAEDYERELRKILGSS